MAQMVRRYALRADVTDSFREKLTKFLSKVAHGFIVAFETKDGENPHIHAIFSSDKTLKSIRNHFTRICDEHKGNEMYSLKQCDDDWEAFIRYICKGESKDKAPTIWMRQGLDYTDLVIKRAHEAYYVNQDAIITNSKRRKKVETGNMVEQVERICKERGYKSYEREEIAQVYMDLYRDARKGINVFAARAVVNTVCLLLEAPECQRKNLAQKIADL